MMLKNDEHHTGFVKKYFQFFLKQTDSVGVSEANELQTKRWKKRERHNF